MKSFTSADLETLTRGRSVSRDAFLAMLADNEAVDDITRLVHVQEIRDGEDPPAEPDLEPPPKMTVTFEELARYSEQRLTDLARVLAVERFLAQHFPEYLAQMKAAAAGADTRVDMRGDTAFGQHPVDQETQLELRTNRPQQGKEHPDDRKRR